MKNKLFCLALLVSLVSSLSSCFVSRDRQGRHTDRGRRYPHDQHPEERH